MIWDSNSLEIPIYSLTEHTAAVKALAWSPHQNNLLASGGGTIDKSIRFWDTSLGTCLSYYDTGSQVCNIMWSKSSNELVSTHGYVNNDLCIWKYPKMENVASLNGHDSRVLYASMSPDGRNIVTGAGDETLRFWNIFERLEIKNCDFSANKVLSIR